MEFRGFTKSDFDTFHMEGLEQRMKAIQETIQPKFKEIGTILTDELSIMVGSEMYLHIAKHARRTVNPPQDTWLAIAGNKRGYKKHPYFQVGLWDDRVFIWLAFIYELPHKTNIANTFIKHIDFIKQSLPGDFDISLDHMKKDAISLSDIDLEQALHRFRTVKKAELLIGKQLFSSNPTVQHGKEFMKYAKETFEKLIPIYRLSYK